MPKVRSASILFKHNVSYDLPVETSSLEIEGDSLFDYKSLKGGVGEGKKCCINVPSKDNTSDYHSENSDSLVSSPESSSDPDSPPIVELTQISDVSFWGKFSLGQKDKKRKEVNFEECRIDCQSTKEIVNFRLPFNSEETMLHSSQSKNSLCVKDSLSSDKNSNSVIEFGDFLKNLVDENNQQDKVICLSADRKDSELENENFFNSILTYDSTYIDKDACLSNMFTTFDNYGVGIINNEECNLPGSIKTSPDEETTFTDLFCDISLKDNKDEGIGSSCSPSLSDIDSFLNSVNLIESVESSDFNSETKLKNSRGVVPCEENISLAALAEQHLQSNSSSSALHTTVKSDYNFSTFLDQSASFDTNRFSPIPSKDLVSSIRNENCEENAMFELLANLSQENLHKEYNNLESDEATLQVDGDNDESEDHFGSSNIDLTSCLKSLRPATPITDSAVVESGSQNVLPDTIHSVSPFRFPCLFLAQADDSPSELKNVNAKQSLFAKALSCKPKKDLSALHKVLKLQSEICSFFFSPSRAPDDTRPTKENAIESNQSVIGSIGRRVFGQIPQCEVS